MKSYRIEQDYLIAYFLERPNRFVMKLKLSGKVISAYLPNTGRMEEFLIPGNEFVITPCNTPKFRYRVIGTFYQNHYVYIDTIRINKIFYFYLNQNLLPELRDCREIKTEVKVGNSRFDFYFKNLENIPCYAELKSCTLCHNQLAMFPDAPTLRGQKHLRELDQIATKKTLSYQLYLITNNSARYFLPNLHTDYDYSRLCLDKKNVIYLTFKLAFINPISLKISSLEKVPIAWDLLSENCRNQGAYLLVLYNPETNIFEIGALGRIRFQRGYYVYAGSAQKNLDQRIKRHRRKNKTIRWHIDYIIPSKMSIIKIYKIRIIVRKETELAEKMLMISDDHIVAFGSGDSPVSSHLVYFKSNPIQTREFQNVLLTQRTFSEQNILEPARIIK